MRQPLKYVDISHPRIRVDSALDEVKDRHTLADRNRGERERSENR
jgi:hypothetical protein